MKNGKALLTLAHRDCTLPQHKPKILERRMLYNFSVRADSSPMIEQFNKTISRLSFLPGRRTELRAGNLDHNIRGRTAEGAQGREGNQTVHPANRNYTLSA